jgi:penicillin-binding protein 1C
MAAQGTLSRPELFRSLSCPLQFSPVPEQALAPHFAYALKKRLPLKAASLVHTYINSHLQILLSRLVKQACASGQEQRIHQAAVLVLRNQDGAVLAWVGSTDFNNPASGQVDGVLALRQPGSTLKPFLYALALEQGRTLNDRLADEPLGLNVAGGIFRPVDYDHKHRGQVSLRVALASSLNLPALRLSQEIGPQVFLARLRQLGFGLPRSAGHYGLGLALGNGEVSLLELTTAYAALARKGVWLPARLWRGQKAAKSQRVLSRSACHLIGQALADDSARALGFGRHSLLELPFAAAVKTGTSQHHRDNWCVGYTRAYTVGVWVGNFEGRPMPGISGLTGAGPLWHQAMLLLNRNNPRPSRSQPAASSLPAVFKSDQAEADLERAGLGTAPVISAPQRLELITPCNGARFALDPDLPPGLQVLTCQARSNFAVSGADWRLNGQKLPPGNSPLSVRIRLRPGRHNLELNAWGRSGKALVRAGFTVSP